MRVLPSLLGLSVLPASAVLAQCGDGPTLTHDVPVLGGNVTVCVGQSDLPGGMGFLALSDGLGPVSVPGLGEVGLDINSPNSVCLAAPLDSSGQSKQVFAVPNDTSLVGGTTIYALGVVVDPNRTPSTQFTKTARVDFALSDSYLQVGSLATPRALHTATALGCGPEDDEVRVLIAGGGGGELLAPEATSSTELYDPLTKTFSAGPDMSEPRTGHIAVRLDDGRVLIIGGADTAGVVSQTCELYDPVTDSFAPAADLSVPRFGHDANLLADGRVLVTGGTDNFVDVENDLLGTFGAAQITAELYDPATDTWSPTANAMTTPRMGHSQALLDDGRVLVAGGIDGAMDVPALGFQVPTFTANVDIWDPATNSFSLDAPLVPARAFHELVRLPSGAQLVCGGTISVSIFGVPVIAANNNCQSWSAGAWTLGDDLSVTAGFLTATPDEAGTGALLHGGFSGDLTTLTPIPIVSHHDGSTLSVLADLGTNTALGLPTAARGVHSATRLYDGSTLIVGGSDAVTALPEAFVYVE